MGFFVFTSVIETNPFSDKITINWAVPTYEVRVYDNIGQLILMAKTNDSNPLIETERWNSGVYIIKVQDKQGNTANQILLK